MKLVRYNLVTNKSDHSFVRYSTRFSLISLLLIASASRYLLVEGIFGCLNQGMYKSNKGVPFMPSYEGADRSGWPPSGQVYPMSIPSPSSYMFGAQPSMKRLLFQPKWRGGLFGGKGWMAGGWKMGPGFQRHGYGYSYPSGYGASPTGGYPMSDLNVAPFSIPSQFGTGGYMGGGATGWSVPVSYPSTVPHIQQSTLNLYDGYSSTPLPSTISIKPTITSSTIGDPYSKKGGGTTKFTTTKNLLVADGGYNIYDAHLIGGNVLATNHNYTTNYGYGYNNYPEPQTSTIDSPARIAQQLLRMNLRGQRLQLQDEPVNLVNYLDSKYSHKFQSQFGSPLGEPRFVGFGSVDMYDNREARLSCQFKEAIDQTNRPIWVKFLGSFGNLTSLDSLESAATLIPTFNCNGALCRTQQIDITKDPRFRIEDGPATSTLIIIEPKISDHGIYRCSALAKSSDVANTSRTIYQIVKFGDIK